MTQTRSTLKRFVLASLTVLVIFYVGFLLFASLGEPQITSRLELYQTDLLLNATELDSQKTAELGGDKVRQAILGEDPLGTALEQYQSVRKLAQADLSRLRDRLNQPGQTKPDIAASPTSPAGVTSVEQQKLEASVRQQEEVIHQLDVRIGILQAEKKDVAAATKTWTELRQQLENQTTANPLIETVDTLMGLWSDAPRILPNAEQRIQKNLDGWFRYRSLQRLYKLQQRSDALEPLAATEQAIAQQTLIKLVLIGTVPLLAGLLGVGLLIFLIVQRLLRGKQSLLEQNADVAWEVPWDWEVIVQVLVVGFFLLGQFVVPFVVRLGQTILPGLLANLGISIAITSGQTQALYAMTYYLTMAGVGLLVLYFSVKPYQPLPEGWFRLKLQSNWFLWGIGSYLVALPLMILISLVNQQIWQGQGGSNPLLQIVLEEADPIALGIFFFTAAVAAPIFEETLFRGFLLPSLNRYMPLWAAIALSSLIFAIAHLSISEVLPLTVLGTILGFIYTRSRNLLSSMLLHSLWNGATMVSLFLLGSGK